MDRMIKHFLTLAFLPLISLANASYSYQDIVLTGADLAGSDLEKTVIVGINSNTVFGSYTDTNRIFHNFIYNSGTYSVIGNGGSNIVWADSNTLIGNSSTNTWYEYNGSDETIFTDEFSSGTNIAVTCVSGSNVAGVWQDTNSVAHGFLYDGTNYTDITYNYGTEGTLVSGISSNTIVGTYTDVNSYQHGFLYNIISGAFTPVNATAGVYGTVFTGIGGTLVSGEYINKKHQTNDFLYNGKSFTVVHGPGGFVTSNKIISTVSNSASLVGISELGAAGNYTYTSTPYYRETNPVFTTNITISYSTNATSTNGSTTNAITNTTVSTNYVTSTIYGKATTNSAGFVLSNGSYVTIADPNQVLGTTLVAISGLDVVGYYADFYGLHHAFLANYKRLHQSISIPVKRRDFPSPPFLVHGSASSGLPVTLSVSSGPASFSGDTLSLTGTGTVTLTGIQSGNDKYSAATNSASFVVVSKP